MQTFITDQNEYPTLESVPPQLQHNIAFAHSTGVPVDALVIIYDFPLEWILTIVLDKPLLVN